MNSKEKAEYLENELFELYKNTPNLNSRVNDAIDNIGEDVISMVFPVMDAYAKWNTGRLNDDDIQTAQDIVTLITEERLLGAKFNFKDEAYTKKYEHSNNINSFIRVLVSGLSISWTSLTKRILLYKSQQQMDKILNRYEKEREIISRLNNQFRKDND